MDLRGFMTQENERLLKRQSRYDLTPQERRDYGDRKVHLEINFERLVMGKQPSMSVSSEGAVKAYPPIPMGEHQLGSERVLIAVQPMTIESPGLKTYALQIRVPDSIQDEALQQSLSYRDSRRLGSVQVTLGER